ncbi:alpha/beta-hydrolase [Pholiota conissans]|uniref:Alpha/beta-hydrolase n=1 Tax=Pholiota conissans TaxID=109636 RepID=A0A9P5ZAC4_9AGAR|nr:alpha/beta-hydrolase [Pholiota conissans]
MQSIKVTNDIEFAYMDSGAPPNKADYTTIVIIHGHTYHSGVFERMFATAPSAGYRLILPNRRLYPGSTPYTPEEAKSLDASNPTEDIVAAFTKQGEYLLLFLNKAIQELGLKTVILSGWSLGTAFICAMVAAIDGIDPEVRKRITTSVKSIILWDPPATAHGIEAPPSGGWIPLYDETLTPEERGPAFGQWLSQYFPHTELEKKDCYKLVYKVETPVKTPTFTGMPFSEILTKVDFSAGPSADNHIADVHFQPAHRVVRAKALFDSTTRKQWNDVSFVVLYGEEVPYNIVWAAWQLEAEAKKKEFPIRFKSIPGANHFAMHDLPELSFQSIQVCL